MRKLVIFCLVAIFCVPTTRGQLLLSGNVGYQHKSSGYTYRGMEAYDGTLPEGDLFTVSARLGLALGKRLELGIKPGVTWSLYLYQTGQYSDDTKKWEMLSQLKKDMLLCSVAPYVRIRVLGLGDLSLCAELTADISWGKGSTETTEYESNTGADVVMNRDTSIHRWGLLLTPVVNYNISDCWSVELYLNMLTLGYSNTHESVSLINSENEDYATSTSEFGVSVAADRGTLLSVGLTYKF